MDMMCPLFSCSARPFPVQHALFLFSTSARWWIVSTIPWYRAAGHHDCDEPTYLSARSGMARFFLRFAER